MAGRLHESVEVMLGEQNNTKPPVGVVIIIQVRAINNENAFHRVAGIIAFGQRAVKNTFDYLCGSAFLLEFAFIHGQVIQRHIATAQDQHDVAVGGEVALQLVGGGQRGRG